MMNNVVAQQDTTPLSEVMAGLSRKQKMIPPKFLYDERGSEIFEEICDLPEYYPTRSEKEILLKYGSEISQWMGSHVLIIEPGSGSGEKVRYLLKEMDAPAGYVPMEISKEILVRMTNEIRVEFPDLKVTPVWADFTEENCLPEDILRDKSKKVIFFPGSTIGNFNPDEAVSFLRKTSAWLEKGEGFLIGADLKKDSQILTRAYDDAAGVTAAFNLNLLSRLNREAHAAFDIDKFSHEAIYNEEKGRIEMHLRSKCYQEVPVGNAIIHFREGETIHTENSYKYSTHEFMELCAYAGLTLKKCWKDSLGLFCVYYFEKSR